MNIAEALKIVNSVLPIAGAQQITSFTEGSAVSDTANAIYEEEVRALLDDPNWRWAQRYQPLNLVAGESPNRFRHVYQLPSDLITLRSLVVNGREITFDAFGDKVTCAYGGDVEVQAFYTYRADESLWPAKFRQAVRSKLLAAFFRSFEKAGEAQAAEMFAAEDLRAARRVTNTQRSGRDPWRSRLVGARRDRDR